MEEIDAIAFDIIANHLDKVYLGKRDEMSSRVEAASILRHRVDAILFVVAAVSFSRSSASPRISSVRY